MNLHLSIGGQDFRVESSPQVLGVVRQRFGRFERPSSVGTAHRAPIHLKVRARPDRFSPTAGSRTAASVRAVGAREVVIEGPFRGRYLVGVRRGYIEDADGLGAVEALIRVALATSAPLDGAVLVHAAAIVAPSGDGIALCGASGTGKSTAAAAIGAACDEMVVLRPVVDGVDLYSTPYWRGYPFRGRCPIVICLERGRDPEFVPHRGSTAALRLMRHVVRYVEIEAVSRAILRVIGRICESALVATATCPEGDAFVPFLREVVGLDRTSAEATVRTPIVIQEPPPSSRTPGRDSVELGR